MLHLDATKRPCAKKVLSHKWIKNGHNLPQKDLSSIKNPKSANNAIGQSINIMTQSRGGPAPAQLTDLGKSGKLIFSKNLKLSF